MGNALAAIDRLMSTSRLPRTDMLPVNDSADLSLVESWLALELVRDLIAYAYRDFIRDGQRSPLQAHLS
jgi:hypothetical protein